MKLKEKEAKKSLSVEELRSELRQVEQNRFRLQFKHNVTPVKNPLELRSMRKQIARLKTWIKEKGTAR
jgi:large subunit ribosomal protein L29